MITDCGEKAVYLKYTIIEVTELFHRLGVPAHLHGYLYLRDAVLLTLEDFRILDSVTGVLYPVIALKYQTTSSKVERAIRHAIETAWNRGKPDITEAIFGYTVKNSSGRPTNSEFIALVADWVRLNGTGRNQVLIHRIRIQEVIYEL